MVTRTIRNRALVATGIVVLAVGSLTTIGLALYADAIFAPQTAPVDDASPQPRAVVLPPADAAFDYQIGEAYPPPSGVRVISRDRAAPPISGLYTICYVNAFQVQPGEVAWWQRNHDDLLLRDGRGEYVVDSDWDEILLDISTPAKRTKIGGIVNGWIDGCAADGFQGVEPDNLDSYGRSQNLLGIHDALAYLEILIPHAHAAGLAIGQKNTAELDHHGKAAGLDFAITEECGAYDECIAYTDVYGKYVLDIEYEDAAFRNACAAVGASASVVRRDRGVTAPSSRTYEHAAC